MGASSSTPSHHKATAPGNRVEGRQWGASGVLSTSPCQRLTQQLGNAAIPWYHGVRTEQVFGEGLTQSPFYRWQVLGCGVVRESQVTEPASHQPSPAQGALMRPPSPAGGQPSLTVHSHGIFHLLAAAGEQLSEQAHRCLFL